MDLYHTSIADLVAKWPEFYDGLCAYGDALWKVVLVMVTYGLIVKGSLWLSKV